MSRKFDIYTDGKGMTVAVTYYGGKSFRGVAKCADGDNFDAEYGKKLAIARCKYKLFKAKEKVAVEKQRAYNKAINFFDKRRKEAAEYEADCKKYQLEVLAEIEELTKG